MTSGDVGPPKLLGFSCAALAGARVHFLRSPCELSRLWVLMSSSCGRKLWPWLAPPHSASGACSWLPSTFEWRAVWSPRLSPGPLWQSEK